MGFVKQVHKYFGATAKWATERLSLSSAEVAQPRGKQGRAGSAQPSPSRGQHTRSVQQDVLAEQSCLPPVWPSRAGKEALSLL